MERTLDSIRQLGVPDFSFLRLHSAAAFVLSDGLDRLGWPQSQSAHLLHVGAVCPPAPPLQDAGLRAFLEAPDSRGTLFIAFGHYANWTRAPPRVLDAFAFALRRLTDYRVVFSFNGDLARMPRLPHVRYVSWAPQKALLAHPNTKLFVGHGGLKR